MTIGVDSYIYAQNNIYKEFFGTHKSAKEVKQLLRAVHANNITKEERGDENIIYINSQELITSNYLTSIKNDLYYIVGVMNDNSTDFDTLISENDAGYYKNGFIRNISIMVAP